jgi:hypothetical protein
MPDLFTSQEFFATFLRSGWGNFVRKFPLNTRPPRSCYCSSMNLSHRIHIPCDTRLLSVPGTSGFPQPDPQSGQNTPAPTRLPASSNSLPESSKRMAFLCFLIVPPFFCHQKVLQTSMGDSFCQYAY